MNTKARQNNTINNDSATERLSRAGSPLQVKLAQDRRTGMGVLPGGKTNDREGGGGQREKSKLSQRETEPDRRTDIPTKERMWMGDRQIDKRTDTQSEMPA